MIKLRQDVREHIKRRIQESLSDLPDGDLLLLYGELYVGSPKMKEEDFEEIPLVKGGDEVF